MPEANDFKASGMGPKADLTARKSDFRFTPESGLRADIAPCPFRADFVAKVG
jgi:hypothetical protein